MSISPSESGLVVAAPTSPPARLSVLRQVFTAPRPYVPAAAQLSATAAARLAQCDIRLQTLVVHLSRHLRLTVNTGYRGQADQDAAFAKGWSKVKFPNSRHNVLPAQAVDIAPIPDGPKSMLALGAAGRLLAQLYGFPIRWGGDFDMDNNSDESDSWDPGHLEIRGTSQSAPGPSTADIIAWRTVTGGALIPLAPEPWRSEMASMFQGASSAR